MTNIKEYLNYYDIPTVEELKTSTAYGEEKCEEIMYREFLKATDYVSSKLIEAQVLDIPVEDYTDLLEARQFARGRINECSTSSIEA